MKRFFSGLMACLVILALGNPMSSLHGQEEADETPAVTQEAAEEKYPVVAERQVYHDPQSIKEIMDQPEGEDRYVLAEVTWGEADASPDYLKKHLPGAIHINTDSIEEGPVWNLRSPEELAKAFARYGIDTDTTLILYGPDTGVDRVAYAALYMGVKKVKILDGGLAAWEAAGFDLEEGEEKAQAIEDFGTTEPLHPEYLLSLDQVQEELKDNADFCLVSLRSENEWLGLESGYSYIPKAGEPKGAVWGRPGLRGSKESNISDMEDFKNPDGTNRSFDEIAAMWEEEGFSVEDDLSFYCGTGWRSCLPWLMMYERGLEATMFDGGWNEWQMNDDLEVQIGDPQSGEVEYKTVKELSTGKETK